MYKIKDLVNEFDVINHGQLGKILQYRLKSAVEQRRKIIEQTKLDEIVERECTF